MKGTYAKQIRRSLFAACLVFVAFLFSTSRVEAQASDSDLSLDWLTESEALSELESEVGAYLTYQGGYAQGSPQWNDAQAHIVYYKRIMVEIEGGIQVPHAVVIALGPLGGSPTSPADNDAPPLNPGEVTALRQDATDLLTQ